MEKDVLRTVAVMHVEIHHSDSSEPMEGADMQGANRNIVEQAKPHGLRPLRVMSRRPHGAEGISKIAPHHAIDSSNQGYITEDQIRSWEKAQRQQHRAAQQTPKPPSKG